MKKTVTILGFAAVMLLNYSCSKSDIENGIDCATESIFEKVIHKTDAENPKKVDFSVEYTGSKTLKSVKWNFGDGTPAVEGQSVSHIYTASGNYSVKSDITVQDGKETCTSSPVKTITIN